MGQHDDSNGSLAAFVRGLWVTYERHGLGAMLEMVPDDVLWQPVAAGDDVIRSKEALLEFWSRLQASGSREQAVPYRYDQDGNCVLVTGSLRQFGPQGWSDSQPLWVYFFTDGKLTRAQGFRSRTEAAIAVTAHNEKH